jgi:3'(2'), 5'-bisphosphate nucleotidase
MTRPTAETRALLEEICLLATKAGAKAMEFYHGRTSVTLKSDSSPLTEADRASHQLLLRFLPGLLPGVPVVSEESEEAVHSAAHGTDTFWLVDPLDGTKEFLKGTGEFTVNIALIEGGRPTLGAVYAPVLNRMFYADQENGAFRRDNAEAPVSIRAQSAKLERLRVVASKDHAGPLVQAMLARLPNAELKSMGSSLKFCLVAEGAADIYLRDVPTMEWDTAAAQCVVEASGGKVCTLDGQALRYGKPGLKNPAIVTIGDPALRWRPLLDAATKPAGHAGDSL